MSRSKWPKPGETFAPADFGWHVFDAVEASQVLNDTQKRILVRLMRLAGGKSWCQVTSAWLSQAIGKGRRQIWEAISRLVRAGYLTRQRRGAYGDVFRFLWHSDYESFQAVSPDNVRNPAHLRGDCKRCADARTFLCAESRTLNVRNPAHFRPPYNPPINTKHVLTRTGESARRSGADPDGFDATEAFAKIWDRHPRKTGRYLAEQAFAQALAEALNPAALAAEIERVHAAWCDSEDWRKQGGRFAPELHRWLRERRWLDGPPQVPEEERIIPYRPPWELEETESNA